MKKLYVSILISVALAGNIKSFASIALQDTTAYSVQLKDVEVLAENVKRVDDHLLILPTKQQLKFANSGYDVLSNLMLPGMSVDAKNGAVTIMGAKATLYINGNPCDQQDVRMLRPKDINRIEYFDAPSGRYTKDIYAINFVVKQYDYGGYVQVDGTQKIGFTRSSYNAAATLNKGKNSYSFFAGAGYSDISSSDDYTRETYNLADKQVQRESYSNKRYESDNQYAQMRMQRRTKKFNLLGTLSLSRSSTPSSTENGTIRSEDNITSYGAETNRKSESPRLNLLGRINLSDNKILDFGLTGAYTKNEYNRHYYEDSYGLFTSQNENVWAFRGNIGYTQTRKKDAFSVQLYQNHDIFNTHYFNENESYRHLSVSETIGKADYNVRLNERVQLQSYIGLNWYRYKIRGNDRFSTLNPLANFRLNYRIKGGMLQWTISGASKRLSVSALNGTYVDVNPYLAVKGNPNLKKSYEIYSYLYCTKLAGKFNILGIAQVLYGKNPVVSDYFVEGGKVIRSYLNNGTNNYLSAICSATYSHSNNLTMNTTLTFSSTNINSREHHSERDFTGKAYLQWRVGNFMFTPSVSFTTTLLDRSSMMKGRNPINYQLGAVYSCDNLYMSLSIVSPFVKRTIKGLLDTTAYSKYMESYNRVSSNYCSLTVSYTFEFGRKIQKIEKGAEEQHNSSLMPIN